MAKKKAATTKAVTSSPSKKTATSKAITKSAPKKKKAGSKEKKPKYVKETSREHADQMRRHLMAGGADQMHLSLAIPCPLAFQYLIDVTGFPLGVLVQLTGIQASRKTTLLFEIIRWFALRQAITYFTLTEGKYSYALQYAVTGLEHEVPNAMVIPFVSENQQEWQRHISSLIAKSAHAIDNGFKDAEGNQHKPGCWQPFLFGLDSYVAQFGAAQTEKITKEGGQDRNFALHVKSLGDWLKVIQTKLSFRPFAFVGINHSEVNKITDWQEERKEKGGRALAYLSSLTIFLKKNQVPSRFVDEPGWAPEVKSHNIVMDLNKSSVGVDNRQITVPLIERDQILESGKTQQRSEFQWGQALYWIIEAVTTESKLVWTPASFKTKKARDYFKAKIKAVVPYTVDEASKLIECKKYSTEMLTENQFGNMLEADPEFVSLFYELFGIKHYPIWPLDMEFGEYLQEVRDDINVKRTTVPKAKLVTVDDPTTAPVPNILKSQEFSNEQ